MTTPAIDRNGYIVTGAGLLAALAILCFSFLSHIGHTLVILVHEMGHAIVGWLFGYPSLPAFDFTYGGGVTVHQGRVTFVTVLVFVGFAALGWMWRRNRLALGVLGAVVALYTVAAFTAIHDVIILFMGHGAELVIAAIFLFRSFTGRCIVNPLERPLYATLGWFIVLADIRFAWRLITSPAARSMYESAKGGGHWMDFSRIAERHLGVPLEAVAGFFLLCCLVTPVAAWLASVYQDPAEQVLLRIADRNDTGRAAA